MNVITRKRLVQRKQRIGRRLRKIQWPDQARPMLAARNIRYEVAERARGVACGGIGAMHLVALRTGLVEAIDRRLVLLKRHLPYHESDHVLNIAYNILAGGTCLEDLERLRTDEAYLDGLGAQRIPDPTTAGDFCRRFAEADIEALMDAVNEVRLGVWRGQPPAFFGQAVIDAGGVGLNLQNASVVVNMDQPWNPAVLEQRIGCVHRLGQHRPVRVVHFISKGTIEEGMLGLLAFKRSLFTGVLDDGQDEVFLGGTRLKRFMDSVEKAATSVPQPMPPAPEAAEAVRAMDEPQAEPAAAQTARAHGQEPSVREPREPTQGPASPDRMWTDIVTAGVSFLEKLGQALAAAGTAPQDAAGLASAPSALLTQDAKTGRPCLQLPLPDPETLRRISDVLAALAKGR